MPNFQTTVGRVRVAGMAEGVSFLLLLGVAMPLKYIAGYPQAVRWTGWIHGLLFIGYCYLLLNAWLSGKLSLKRCGLGLVAALLPFGPFILDRRLAEDERRELQEG